MTYTIASGATDSDSLQFGISDIVALVMPAAFTGATVSFKVSDDNSTFVPFYKDDGTLYSVTVGTSRAVDLDPRLMAAVRAFPWVKITSASAEGAARSVVVKTRLM